MHRWLPLAAVAALLALAPGDRTIAPAALPVRWSEGTVHGFLELRTAAGELLAHGDLLQAPRDSDIESRLIFAFPDGSKFRETVRFTQHQVFVLKSYRLEQHGNAFAAELDATVDGNGEYVVTTTPHKDGKERRYTGKLDLPADVYNGMIPVIAKNISAEQSHTVHVVAFTPKPLVIPLEFVPSGTEQGALHFTLKPRLNVLQKIGAALKHQTPPDSHLWIVTEGVPAFVRFEGPMYSGPVWRIDLTGPRWPRPRR